MILPICGYVYIYFPRIFNLIAQIIVDASQISINSISITDCQPDSFKLSLVASISNAGPLAALIDSMRVEMSSEQNGTSFASITLPEVAIDKGTAQVRVVNQRVQVRDQEAFHVFNKNLINQSELILYLTARTRITALGVSTTVNYKKTVVLRGMEGVHIKVLHSRKSPKTISNEGIEVDVNIRNTSRVSMSLGTVHVSLIHEHLVVADLRAKKLEITPGDNLVTFHGSMTIQNMLPHPKLSLNFMKRDAKSGQEVRAIVVGTKGEQCAWVDKVVKEIESPVTLNSTLKEIYQSLK